MSPAIPALGLGLGTTAQETPFQCSTRVLALIWPVEKFPTAQMSRADRALTPDRKVCPNWPGLGLGTIVHFVPFQCSTSVTVGPELPVGVKWKSSPTAQMLAGETTATALSTSSPGRLGLRTSRHLTPFQCSISVRSGKEPWSPTAHTFVAEIAAPLPKPPTSRPAGWTTGTFRHR